MLERKKKEEMEMEKATFAAGCFWGIEASFRQIPGVIHVTVGYSGGTFENPTYQDVCSGHTGHAEAVLVEFDPAVVSYENLVEAFWNMHDPTTLNRQGPDIGTQYRSAIFYHSPEQETIARTSKQQRDSSGRHRKPIVTEIVPAAPFYRAEEYHQQYFAKRGISHCAA